MTSVTKSLRCPRCTYVGLLSWSQTEIRKRTPRRIQRRSGGMPKAWSGYALCSARRAHPIVGRRSIGDRVMRTLPLAVSAVADEDLSRQSRLECSGSRLDRSTSQVRISQKLDSTTGR
jgi:hypothetical protein